MHVDHIVRITMVLRLRNTVRYASEAEREQAPPTESLMSRRHFQSAAQLGQVR